MTPEQQDLIYTLDPLRYVDSVLRVGAYAWQAAIIRSEHKRKVINGARQAGKSMIISAKVCHTARFYPRSTILVEAPTERQAVLDMRTIRAFIALDPDYPPITRSSDQLIELATGSVIWVVPATDTSSRGYSKPRKIILDEFSRIPDEVFTGGIVPMLTDNAECEVIGISTPNGKQGSFFRAFQSTSWERYEIRAPWDVDAYGNLRPAEPEESYQSRRVADGIRAWYSPRHHNQTEQSQMMEDMGGVIMYRQECLCEFVEPDDQVFTYEQIQRAVEQGKGVPGLDMSIAVSHDNKAFTYLSSEEFAN